MADTPLLPPHRSFVSVELPFLVAPAPSPSPLAERQLAEVRAFLPPEFVSPCCVESPVAAGGAGGGPERDIGDASGSDGDEDPPATAPQDDGRHTPQHHGAAAEEGYDASETPERAGDGSGPRRFGFTDPEVYNTAPVLSGWRPLDWAVDDGRRNNNDTSAEAGGDGEPFTDADGASNFLKRHRREVFPSTVPQMLVHGYFRNDLLLRVARRRRVRRLRDAATGEVVSEVEMPADDAAAEPTATVVGVVSREVQLSRPADFSFALFTEAQHEAAPACCSADLFPPMHFLSPRAPTQVPYAMGADVNTSVEAQQQRIAAAGGVEGVDVGVGVGGAAAADTRRYTHLFIRGVAVAPESEALPPPLSAEQREHLAYFRFGDAAMAAVAAGEHWRVPQLDAEQRERGDEGILAEAVVMCELLASRPVWSTAALMAAMMASGRCPRTYTNKQVLLCLTYIVQNGAFNRLRIRTGYDPYASGVASARYQRLEMRLRRSGETGTRLRDLSRSPHIDEALAAVARRHAADVAQYRQQRQAAEAGPGGRLCCETLLDQLLRAARHGRLNVTFQLEDVLDDAVFRRIVDDVRATEPLPLARRRSVEGWLSLETHRHAVAHLQELLAQFLSEEVVPALREARGAHGKAAAADKKSTMLAAEKDSGASGDDDDGDDDGDGDADSDDGDSDTASSALSSRGSTASAAVSSLDEEEDDDDDDDAYVDG